MENSTLRITLKVFSIIAVVLGALALLDGAVDGDGYAVIGGGLFLVEGWLALAYLGSRK